MQCGSGPLEQAWPLWAAHVYRIRPTADYGFPQSIVGSPGWPWCRGSDQAGSAMQTPCEPVEIEAGRKVVISDTNHYAPPGRADALWAWKSFVRDHHPILMDFGIIGGVDPPDRSVRGPMPFETFEAARWAMGDTVRLAERLNLIEMEPRGELSSTGFVLASEGREYVVLQPIETAD